MLKLKIGGMAAVKMVILTAFAILPFLASAADKITQEDYTYYIDEEKGCATVRGLAYEDATLINPVIVDKIVVSRKTYKVTEIDDRAFLNKNLYGTLTLPNTLERIGDDSFHGCTQLTGELILPESLTSIGRAAFQDCSGFTGSLAIPGSVTYIGGCAFQFCSGFSGSLTIPSSVTFIGVSAFQDCSGFTGSLTIPNSVKTLEAGAFQGCSGFDGSLTISNSITAIGESTFDSCSGFTGSLVIPNSVKTIGLFAFKYCSGFSGTLTISPSVMTIGEWAFLGCRGFTRELTIPNSVKTLEAGAFQDCSGFNGTLTISNSVKAIGASVFEGCSGLTGSLVIPNSVKTIGKYAFHKCSGFTGSLTISNSVTSIGEYAFQGCSGFTGSLTIPNSVTSIGEWAFQGCSGFNGSLTLSNSVKVIEDYTFAGCTGFTGSLIIPASVQTIEDYAFMRCSGFTGGLTIPNSVQSIGGEAFDGCSGFTGSLTIPNSVQTIGFKVFSGCSGFTGSLTIPNSVTSIGEWAFYKCSGFTGSLTIPSSMTSIGDWAFDNCKFNEIKVYGHTPAKVGTTSFSIQDKHYTPLYVPAQSVSQYKTAEGWRSFRQINPFDVEEPNIVLDQSELKLFVGQSETLNATVNPDNAVDKTIVWVSSDDTVATISVDGVVTGVSAGKAQITASYEDVSATCIVTVEAKLVQSLKISPEEFTGYTEESFRIETTVLPENATNKKLNFLSSNENVAKVDAAGNVTLYNEGIAVVKVKTTDGSGVNATCIVTVVPKLVESLKISPEEFMGKAGDSFRIETTVLPEDAANKTLNFSSSNENVATVNYAGNVTLYNEGIAVIKVTTTDGSNIEARCVIASTSGIEELFTDEACRYDVYSVTGMLLRKDADKEYVSRLSKGIYILINGNKVIKLNLTGK